MNTHRSDDLIASLGSGWLAALQSSAADNLLSKCEGGIPYNVTGIISVCDWKFESLILNYSIIVLVL